MKKDLMQYKGYSCRPEYSADDHIFFGKILGIRDMVYFQSDSAKDIEREFHEAVDDYLEFCAEVGKEPEKERGRLPEKALEAALLKKLVRTWDPDFTKVTPQEAREIEEVEASGFVDETDIDWDNLSKYAE